jgi:hypothetical protein
MRKTRAHDLVGTPDDFLALVIVMRSGNALVLVGNGRLIYHAIAKLEAVTFTDGVASPAKFTEAFSRQV